MELCDHPDREYAKMVFGVGSGLDLTIALTHVSAPPVKCHRLSRTLNPYYSIGTRRSGLGGSLTH